MTPQRALEQLLNIRVSGVGAVGSLVMIQFGELRQVSDNKGGTKSIGEFAIHLSCAWRITRNDSIIAGFGDWEFRESEHRQTKVEPRFKSLVHQRLTSLDQDCSSHKHFVQSIEIGVAGAFALQCSDFLRVEVAPMTSYDDVEYWRLLQPESEEPHFVVGFDGFELV
jgi:hypothetical protein